MTNTSKVTPTHYFLSLSRRPVPLFGSYRMLIDQLKEEFCFFRPYIMVSLLALFSAFLSSLSSW